MQLIRLCDNYTFTEGEYFLTSFKLSTDTIERLKTKFFEFQKARIIVQRLMKDYLNDYYKIHTDKKEREEILKEKYAPLAPNTSHLIRITKDIFYWNIIDIAIIMGRDATSISRTIAQMKKSILWKEKLFIIQHDSKSSNGNSIFVYDNGIFSLIFDYYEDEYLLRFSKPRRTTKNVAQDITELRAFWQFLKTQYT